MPKLIDSFTAAKTGTVHAVTSDGASTAGQVEERVRRSIVVPGRGTNDVRIRSLHGDRVVIEVERAGKLYSLAGMTFAGEDGSLQVHFPYFGATRAVFANLTLKQQSAAGYEYEFQSDRVDVFSAEDLKGFKLSHKATSGYVDFNRWRGKDDKACGPWRKGMPLATAVGRVAEASVFEPSGLRDAKSPKGEAMHVRFLLNDGWEALTLRIRWDALDRISNRSHGTGFVGPLGYQEGSEPGLFAFVRAPLPHADRVACISVTPIARPKGGGRVMTVVAGFENPDVPPEKAGVCLGAMYVIDAHPCCLKRGQ